MLKKIISGGQTGVDIAALRAAKRVGLETGGDIPKGFRTQAGPRPEYAEMYGLKETVSPEYPQRTINNTGNSDATLLIGTDLSSRGSRLARGGCNMGQKMCMEVQWPTPGYPPCTPVEEELIAHILESAYETINVAGNRDISLEPQVENWLVYVFSEVIHRKSRADEKGEAV